MNGLAGCYVSTIGKPHEYFDLTGSRACPGLKTTSLRTPNVNLTAMASPGRAKVIGD